MIDVRNVSTFPVYCGMTLFCDCCEKKLGTSVQIIIPLLTKETKFAKERKWSRVNKFFKLHEWHEEYEEKITQGDLYEKNEDTF